MTVKTILGIVPGLQAASLVAMNMRLINKFPMKPAKNIGMKKPIKNIVKLGVGTLVGISLIKPTSEIINQL